MKRNTIDKKETIRILEMHNRERKNKGLFVEQKSTLKDQLQDYIDNGCIQGGQVRKLKSTNPNREFAIEKESVKNPGTFNYFFADFSVGTFDSKGNFSYLPGKWACKKISTRDEIDQLKREQNWKERKELNVSDADLSNTSKWETKKVGNVTLYRMIGGITATKELGADAQAILDSLEKTGWSTADKTPANKRVGGIRLSSLRPDWKQYFSDDLILYPNPNAVARSKNQTPEDMDDTQKFTQSLENLTIDGCKTEIEEFFNLYAYEVTSGIDPFEIAKRKRTIQYCARKFNFDKLIYAKTRKKLFVLAGYSNDQGTGTPRESPFRINLPPNYKP